MNQLISSSLDLSTLGSPARTITSCPSLASLSTTLLITYSTLPIWGSS
ncbi:hypothetical protein ACSU1N_02220 [Thermogladius sp. 4427co]